MIVYIGGVAGVGKTTTVKAIEENHGRAELNIVKVPLKEILWELAGVKSQEEFICLPEEIRGSLHPEAARRIYEADRLDPSTVRVYDGRFLHVDKSGEKWLTRPIQSDDHERVLLIAVLVALPKIIVQRRNRDKEIRPDRKLVKASAVSIYQDREIAIAAGQARQIGVYFHTVNVSEKTPAEAASELISLIGNAVLASKRG